MELEELIERYPRLYHMAEDGSWPSIERLGLLSTEGLVDAFAITEPARSQVLAHHRPASIRIDSAAHGGAVIRDQIPLREAVLMRVLEDELEPAGWYRILNSFVFFWPTSARLDTLLSARAYRDRIHTVLTFDTRTLLAAHGERVYLSPINSGATLFDARPRGLSTFKRPDDYPFDEMRRRRGVAGAIAEVAVRGGVTPVAPALISVTRRHGDKTLDVVWTRPSG